MIRTALRYASGRGFAVFPCFPKSKRPATPRGLKDASSDPAVIEAFYQAASDKFHIPVAAMNLALATGTPSGLFVFDVDGEEGKLSVEELEAEHGSLPRTLTALTADGEHRYFLLPEKRVRSSTSKIAPGIDIRGEGACAMLPPSRHPSGHHYAWASPHVPIVAAPAWLVEAVTREPEPPPPPKWTERLDTPPGRDKLLSALHAISPDLPRSDWIRVGAACKNAGLRFEDWNEWSAKGRTYQAAGMPSQWNSFGPEIREGTLFYIARLHGWRSPEHDRSPKHVARSGWKK